MPEVAASETGPAQTVGPWTGGVVGPTDVSATTNRSPLERGTIDGDSPVDEVETEAVGFLSNARLVESGVKPGGPPSKAKDSRVTDSGQVP
jgi:hypothetical protein